MALALCSDFEGVNGEWMIQSSIHCIPICLSICYKQQVHFASYHESAALQSTNQIHKEWMSKWMIHIINLDVISLPIYHKTCFSFFCIFFRAFKNHFYLLFVHYIPTIMNLQQHLITKSFQSFIILHL